MATTIDLIAIAQDIAQESCYYIPIANPERIVQRRYVFEAARVVKEMCKAANGKGKVDVASTVLYGALVVEYAAKFEFSAKSSMSESKRCVLASTTILSSSRRSLTATLGFWMNWKR